MSALPLIQQAIQFVPRENIDQIPHKIRGLYVLYRKRKYNGEVKLAVVYVGIAFGNKVTGVHGRIKSPQNKDKHLSRKLWTHFSIFKVWLNVSQDAVRELEGILRHIYRRDSHANRLNQLGGFDKLRKKSVRVERLDELV